MCPWMDFGGGMLCRIKAAKSQRIHKDISFPSGMILFDTAILDLPHSSHGTQVAQKRG